MKLVALAAVALLVGCASEASSVEEPQTNTKDESSEQTPGTDEKAADKEQPKVETKSDLRTQDLYMQNPRGSNNRLGGN